MSRLSHLRETETILLTAEGTEVFAKGAEVFAKGAEERKGRRFLCVLCENLGVLCVKNDLRSANMKSRVD